MSSSCSRRLRIAVLTRNFNSVGGGAERYSMALVKELAARHDVHVFAQRVQYGGNDVIFHRIPQFLSRPRWINQLWFALATWWSTRQGFDVVHSHELTWHGQVQTIHVVPVRYSLFSDLSNGARWGRWLKVVMSPRLLTYLALEHFRFSVSDDRCIVLSSPSQRASIDRAYPHARAACRIVSPGVHAVPGITTNAAQVHARKLLNLPTEGKCVLFVGNDFIKKGLPSLLEALKGLAPDVFVVVVGNPTQRVLVREEVERLAIGARVFFVGALSEVELAYQAADCLAHPTLEDTFAMVVLEAMSHGLPVVVSGPVYCGIASLLTDGQQALLLNDPRNADELGEKLREALDSSDSVDQLRENGLAFARMHQWATIAREQEAIYFRCANSRPSQGTRAD